MHYLLLYDVVPDYADRRRPLRAAHLAHARDAVARGELLLGGALAHRIDGAILIFRGDSPAAVLYGLREAPWPGNVRELQHCIERAVVTTKGPALRCADVVALGLKTAADLRSVSKGAKTHAEKSRIIEALKDSRGNRAKAAKTLKISRAGLYNKLREYGLS